MRRLFAFAASLIAGLLLAWMASRTPAPRGADAPATAFSAARAFEDVEAIARRPRPTGSAENARVRGYLVARLRAMGLRVEERRMEAAAFGPRAANLRGRPVVNIVATLPGRTPTAPALVVMSHYDSVPRSPGAADDAAGVAASLETARALIARGRPVRDVVFLFTDGEELGLYGARAYFSGADARRVGAVLNLEARGGGGRAIMFETGRGPGDMVGLYARVAEAPTSNSLAAFVYEAMPNDTDFSPAKARGLAGMNFAFIGRPAQYHDASSTPARLDRGALQHLGEQTLASAAALAFAERLPERTPAPTYSDLLGAVLLVYPAWLGWGVLLAAAAPIAFAAQRARRSGLLPLLDLAQGVGAAVYLLVASAAALRIAGALARRLGEQTVLRGFPVYEAVLALLCLGAGLLVFRWLGRERARLGAMVVGGVLALGLAVTGPPVLALAGLAAAAIGGLAFARPAAPWSVWMGFLGLGLVLGVALQALAPTTAFIVAWPLVVAGISALLLAFRPSLMGRPAGMATPGVFAALAIGQLAAWAHGVALGVGLFLPEALALFAWLILVVAGPLLLAPARRLV